jgi:mono/diheme cytochrome c family protein
MRLWKVMLIGMMMPGAALAWPWSQDMMNQPSIKPQKPIEYDGKLQMMPFPPRSVPVTGIPTQIHNRDEAKGLTNPIPPTEASINKGRTLFRIYCAACHGLTGGANSPITPKIGAINLREDYAQKQLTEGWIFGTITFGSAIMPAYGDPMGRDDLRGANDLTVEERWNVVNYVKHGMLKDPEDINHLPEHMAQAAQH